MSSVFGEGNKEKNTNCALGIFLNSLHNFSGFFLKTSMHSFPFLRLFPPLLGRKNVETVKKIVKFQTSTFSLVTSVFNNVKGGWLIIRVLKVISNENI